VVDHSHWGFDVIREQGFDIIKDENFVFENHTLNEDMLMLMLNTQKTIKKLLTFWSNFFNLLTHSLNDKLESLSSLLRIYRVYSESTKKSLFKS